jgi:nucleotide-binding universal stress UspA family protein
VCKQAGTSATHHWLSPAPNTGKDMIEIVVGIDGSAASNAALTWAWEEAQLRVEATLVVVLAYRPPDIPRSPAAHAYLPPGTLERLAAQERLLREEQETYARQRAERLLDDALAAVGVGDDGPVVKRVVVSRHPAKTLVEMSREADLLVVGSRGHGGFKGLLVGSVSQQCLHHASCPVVVVR